jgi:hypothetical protein
MKYRKSEQSLYSVFVLNFWGPQRKEAATDSYMPNVTQHICTIALSGTPHDPLHKGRCSSPSSLSPCTITKHTHLLRIQLPVVTVKITWCKMATGVALQVFIWNDHATEFSEFVWGVKVLPTAKCMAKPQDCAPVASIAECMIANLWRTHSNTKKFTGTGIPRLTVQRMFRLLAVRHALRLCGVNVYCVRAIWERQNVAPTTKFWHYKCYFWREIFILCFAFKRI